MYLLDDDDDDGIHGFFFYCDEFYLLRKRSDSFIVSFLLFFMLSLHMSIFLVPMLYHSSICFVWFMFSFLSRSSMIVVDE